MKIVIDIDDEDYYDLIEKSKQYPIDMFTNAQSSIIKGTTLDSVLDEVRERIEQEYNLLRATRADETLELGECLGLKMSLKIIDEYRKRV